jgi:hypothetical protein
MVPGGDGLGDAPSMNRMLVEFDVNRPRYALWPSLAVNVEAPNRTKATRRAGTALASPVVRTAIGALAGSTPPGAVAAFT